MAGQKVQMIMEAVDKITKPLKGVKKQHQELADKVKKVQAAIDATTSQQKDIERYRTLQRELKQTNLAFTHQKSEVKQLTERIKQSDKPNKALERQLTAAKRKLERLRGASKKAGESLREITGKLKESGITSKNLSSKITELTEKTERYNATLKKSKSILEQVRQEEKRLQQAQNKRDRAMNVATGAGVAGASAIAASQSIKQKVMAPIEVAASFEAQMSSVGAISRATSADLALLTDQARDYGAKTVFSATEVASAQEYLALAGFDTNQIMQSLGPTLNLAQAGNLDLARASDIASDTLSGFGLQADQMTRVIDVMAATSTRANTSVDMLGSAFEPAASVAGSLGGTIEEVSAVLGIMANVGIKAGKAGTAVAAMYTRLSAPPAEGKKALEELGIEVFDLEGKMRSMPDIMQDISQATKGMTDEQISPMMKAIFGAEASVAAGSKAILAAASKNELLPMVQELQGVQGESAKVAAQMTDNYQGLRKSLDSAVESMQISIANALMPAVKDLTVWFTKAARKVDEFAQENPNLVKWLGIAAIAIGGVLAVVGPLMIMISGIVGTYATFTYAMTAASVATTKFNLITGFGTKVLNLFRLSTWASTAALIKQQIVMRAGAAAMAFMRNAMLLLNLAFYANPIGLVIAAVTGLIGLAALFVDDWGAVGDWFSNMWAKIMEFLDPLISKVKSFFSFFGGSDEAKVTISKETRDKVTQVQNDIDVPDKAMDAVSNVSRLQPKTTTGTNATIAAGAIAASAALPIAATEQPTFKPVEPLQPTTTNSVTVEGDTVEINISTKGDFEPSELMKLIRDEMDKRDRQKEQKIRGSLYDIG